MFEQSTITRPRTDAHVCPACRQPFVVPVEVVAVLPGRAGYVMRLACTNCGHVQVGPFDEDAMVALDQHLDRTQAEMRAVADRMARILFESDARRFAAALHAGHVLPEDF